jgi:diguanylate cyclase (GGDEF)-like protein
MHIRSLQTRIVLFIACLLLAVQLATFALINTILWQNSNSIIQRDLVAGERVFKRLREQNILQLVQAVAILSSDFGFRKAIASRSHATISSALENHGARIRADMMTLVALDGTVLADTLQPGMTGKSFRFPALVASAELEGKASAIVLIAGRVYQLVIVPVLAPLPVAWVATGFVMDDRLVADLESLTLLNVSILGIRNDRWTTLATTLPAALKDALAEGLKEIGPTTTGSATVSLHGEEYQTLVSPLDTQGDATIVAVLQRSVHEAMQPLLQFRDRLLTLAGVSLLASILGSLLIAGSVTRPLDTLARLARRIEQGDYSQPITIARKDEIGDLAAAFNHMRSGIAVREKEIMNLVQQDPLTGLPNRVLFSDRLQQAISASRRSQKSVSVLIMDLDNFKDVNDTLGHHNGDLLLKEVGARLKSAVLRESDTVARLGGDEFAILLPADDAQAAQVVARRLLDRMEQPVMLEGQSVDVHGSVGIASWPEHGEDVSTLMRRADTSMYVAKQSNTGFAVYDPSYEKDKHERLSLMGELRRAVEQDELKLYYQPKVLLAGGRTAHVEALVRWQHPERGLMPPDKFIPFSEQTGFIGKITLWVIERALRQSKQWRSKGLEVNISVNVSARDLLSAELPEAFAKLLAAYEVSPQHISLEVTESTIMSEPARALATMQRLHGMGLKLSIDDFGTGYSSLAYLKKLPVSELKIDKSFVKDMATDKDDAIIVRSTIDLGHNMGLRVVAEGVEDQETWNLLKVLGCDFAQGYHIGRPVPAEQLECQLFEALRAPALRAV